MTTMLLDERVFKCFQKKLCEHRKKAITLSEMEVILCFCSSVVENSGCRKVKIDDFHFEVPYVSNYLANILKNDAKKRITKSLVIKKRGRKKSLDLLLETGKKHCFFEFKFDDEENGTSTHTENAGNAVNDIRRLRVLQEINNSKNCDYYFIYVFDEKMNNYYANVKDSVAFIKLFATDYDYKCRTNDGYIVFDKNKNPISFFKKANSSFRETEEIIFNANIECLYHASFGKNEQIRIYKLV